MGKLGKVSCTFSAALRTGSIGRNNIGSSGNERFCSTLGIRSQCGDHTNKRREAAVGRLIT